jgi:crotonobetainyl-CoA:carnitine CoA-transferase CaiB-like acyl-CoA transferase
MNRNKRSVVLDLKQPAGLAILLNLVKGADVLIDSFRPQVMAKMGLDFAHLQHINPRLVACSLSGFGQQGPMANTAAHDLNLAGLTGVLATGQSQVLPIQAMDFGGAYLAAFGIMTALFARERTGQGAFIDAALLDAGLSLMTLARADSFARQQPPHPSGEVLTGGYACYRVYTTSDGQAITLAALEPKFWMTFCQLAGRDDLAKANYLDPDEQPYLIEQVTALCATKSQAEWMQLLATSETCVNEVLDVLQAAQYPQIQARQALYVADGIAHTYTPFHLGGRIPHQPAPALGADTYHILQQAGYPTNELQSLAEQGIINHSD